MIHILALTMWGPAEIPRTVHFAIRAEDGRFFMFGAILLHIGLASKVGDGMTLNGDACSLIRLSSFLRQA